MKAHIEDQEAEEKQLRRIIARAEAAVEQLKKDIDQVGYNGLSCCSADSLLKCSVM